MTDRSLLTSESVSDGHPDKICDQISDAILDACLAGDPNSRVAMETAIKNDTVFVFGELTTNTVLDIDKIVKDTLTDIGHGDTRWGMNLNKLSILKAVTKQSQDIAVGVDRGNDVGAGDQGMMFGFACDETDQLMPLPIQLSHRLMARHRAVRLSADGQQLGPDAKSQVTVVYEDGRPVAIDTIVLSTQHTADVSLRDVQDFVRANIIEAELPREMMSDKTKILINPTGIFIDGGSSADAGLTGRKIIVDTYGGAARHGGGAFSGKDPTKVDRSAAYAARQIAKSVVASGAARQAEVQISYAIGVAEPVSVTLWTPEGKGQGLLSDLVPDVHSILRPRAIIERMGLTRPIYRETARFGHFGRSDVPWETPLTDAESGRVAA